jgi:O-antigen ligase
MENVTEKTFWKDRLHLWIAALALFFVPFERIPTWNVAGVTVKIAGILVLLYGVLFIPQIFSKKNWKNLSFLDYALLAYYLVVIISVFIAPNLRRALTVTSLIGVCLLAYHLFSRLPRPVNWAWVQRTVVVSGLVTSVFGLYQFVGDTFGMALNYTGLITPYSKLVLGFPRLQSVGHEPLYFANFLLFPLSILIWNILLRKKIFGRFFDWFSLLIIALALTLTVSRGSFVAVIVAGIFCLAVVFNRKYPAWKPLFLTIFTFVAVVMISLGLIDFSNNRNNKGGGGGVETFTKQVTVQDVGVKGSSADQRLEHWVEAWRLFKTSPIIGVGIGNYGKLNRVQTDLSANPNPIVNNLYLEILAETGILGFLTSAAGLFYLMWKLRENVLGKVEVLPSLFMATTIIAILAQVMFFSTIYIIYFWVVLGLASTLISKRNAQE